MAWYLDTTRIVVTEKSSDHKQIIARLQPLDASTIYHRFGYEKWVYKLNAFVVSDGNLADLIAMEEDGEEHVFSGPRGFTNVLVNSVLAKETTYIYQTIDPDQDCTAPVWEVDLELYRTDE